MAVEYCKTLQEIAKPFIESGLYDSVDAFVGTIIREVAAKKINTYQRKIKAYETRYGTFESFTRNIRGKASPKQEDQWMAWEASINMLKAWKHVTSELEASAL